MPKRWITSDWHLGENRWDIMQRPGFKDQQHMIDYLVDLHNAMVKPEDLVYVVGDVIFKEAPEFLEQVDRFNGEKLVVRGNHDVGLSDSELEVHFSKVIAGKTNFNVFAGGTSIHRFPSDRVDSGQRSRNLAKFCQ